MRRPHWSPNTSRVHEATAYASEKGLDGEFHHAAAKAYWEDGVDLSDMNVLKDLADESGLDWARAFGAFGIRLLQRTGAP